MPFIDQNNLRFFQFMSLGNGISHAFFTRKGGVSPDPWKGLNMGATVGDAHQRVMMNRRLGLESLGMSPDSVFDVWQVHSSDVVVTESPLPVGVPHQKADAILTNRAGIVIMMRFADCVPIMLHDPVKKVVGIVHAGWMGTVSGIVYKAVQKMDEHFNSQPADIIAGIGPSIGPDHYKIGEDVIRRVTTAFGDHTDKLLINKSGCIHFDMWTANRILLEKAGVNQIEVAEICTACHTEDWFSHRAEKGRTGRFGAILALV